MWRKIIDSPDNRTFDSKTVTNYVCFSNANVAIFSNVSTNPLIKYPARYFTFVSTPVPSFLSGTISKTC